MSTVTVKQKAPVFGAILLIIYALHTGFTSISNLFNIILNAISAFSTPDYVGEARITLLFNAIRMAIAEILSNPLGLVPLVCIMIAVLSIAKKKGVLLLIASALMTVFSLSRLVGTISSILINCLQTFINLSDHGSITDLLNFWSLDSLILAPVMALAASLSMMIMWFFFMLLVPACADGKLGFLRKIKKLIGALFTISIILMLICTLGSALRGIAYNIFYPIWLQNQYGVYLNMTYYITSSISAVVSVIATILFAIGLSSIASWMKKPAAVKVAEETLTAEEPVADMEDNTATGEEEAVADVTDTAVEGTEETEEVEPAE